jgi:MFS family permease
VGAIVLVGFFDNFSQFPIVAPYARSLGAAPGLVGLVVAIYSLTNLVGNLAAGFLLDRYGRRRLLVAGLLAAAGAVSLYAAVVSPEQLLAVRALHGLAAAILAPAAFTLLGDLFPAERRGRAMGASGALIALAAVIAPAVSGVLRDRLGYAAVFFTVAALFLVTALIALLIISEPPRVKSVSRSSPNLLALLVRRGLAGAYLAATALAFGLGTLVTQLPLHLADRGYGGAQTGFAFSAFALAAMVVMGGVIPRLGGPGRWLLLAGWGLGAAAVALLALSTQSSVAGIAGSMVLYGLGFGLIFPSANAQVADATDRGERGSAFGLFYALYSLGVVLGAAAAGFLAGGHGLFSPFASGAAVCLPAAAILLLRPRAGVASEETR